MQQPLPQQVQFRAPVPDTLEQLHPTDRPHALPRTPGRGEGGDDRLDVVTKAMSDGLNGWDARHLGGVEPRMAGGHIAVRQQGLKSRLPLRA
jgi:hypothetical protein